METHFEILIDASGSMGYMKGSEHEDKYLLPDKSTRTTLVKKIINESLLFNLSFANSIKVSTFRNSYNYDTSGNIKKGYRWVENKEGNKVKELYYPMPHKLHPVYNGDYKKEVIISSINSIENPEIGGTPLWWALSVMINKLENKSNILVLSDGDANDKENFDEEILKLIEESKKECTIHFIGIDQNEVAVKKSKNLAEKTGGIYTNLKAMNYDKEKLNVLLSKLNTTIISKALEENIKDTQTIAVKEIMATPKVEVEKIATESIDVSIEEKEAIPAANTSILEKQVHKNTASLELISSQLNNIVSLLQSKDNDEEEFIVIENEIYNKRIGRSAEEFLYKKLKELFKDTSTQINWLNEHEEQGLFYDFLIEGDKGKFYYECKGTASDLNEFQLTKNEWDFYLDNKGKYRLCFVSNVETEPSYIRYMDLFDDMKNKILIPCSTKNKAYKANRIVFQIIKA